MRQYILASEATATAIKLAALAIPVATLKYNHHVYRYIGEYMIDDKGFVYRWEDV